jgi:hypothetical protein
MKAEKADLEFHRNGFELRHIRREVTDWTDEAEIQRLEYPVLTRLCKEWMGCKQVIFLPSTHRDAAALNQTDSSVKRCTDYCGACRLHRRLSRHDR